MQSLSIIYFFIKAIFFLNPAYGSSCIDVFQMKLPVPAVSYTVTQLTDFRSEKMRFSIQHKMPYSFLNKTKDGFIGMDLNGQVFKIDGSGNVINLFKIKLTFMRDDRGDYQKIVVSENGKWMVILGLKTIFVDISKGEIVREIENYKTFREWMEDLVFVDSNTAIGLDKAGRLYKLDLSDPNSKVVNVELSLSGVVNKITLHKNLLYVTGAFGNMIVVDPNSLNVVRTVYSDKGNKYGQVVETHVIQGDKIPSNRIRTAGTTSKGELFVVTESYPVYSVYKVVDQTFVNAAEVQLSEFDDIYNLFIEENQLVLSKWNNGSGTTEYKALDLSQF